MRATENEMRAIERADPLSGESMSIHLSDPTVVGDPLDEGSIVNAIDFILSRRSLGRAMERIDSQGSGPEPRRAV
jgi:hypothetical protein